MLFHVIQKLEFKLNGVELPCGSILSVEPADMNYKEKQARKECNDEDIKRVQIEEKGMRNAPSNTLEDVDDDNLDDFFASL